MIIGWHLAAYVYPNKLGRVLNSQTDFELKGVGKRQPDVAFVSLEKLPVNVRDTVPVEPDLAVEVVSKTDSIYDTEDKVDEFLKAGVKMVWVVRPVHKLIEVYRPGQPARLLNVNDELEGEDVLPGFKLSVGQLYS